MPFTAGELARRVGSISSDALDPVPDAVWAASAQSGDDSPYALLPRRRATEHSTGKQMDEEAALGMFWVSMLRTQEPLADLTQFIQCGRPYLQERESGATSKLPLRRGSNSLRLICGAFDKLAWSRR